MKNNNEAFFAKSKEMKQWNEVRLSELKFKAWENELPGHHSKLSVILMKHELDLNGQIRKRLQKCRNCFYFNKQSKDTKIYRHISCKCCEEPFLITLSAREIVCFECSVEHGVCVECTQPLD